MPCEMVRSPECSFVPQLIHSPTQPIPRLTSGVGSYPIKGIMGYDPVRREDHESMNALPGRQRPNFVVDMDSFRLLRDDIGIGSIREISPADAGLLAPDLGTHHETIYIATSGVNIDAYSGWFQSGEQQLAVEWVRREGRLKANEPECNAHRYIFGITPGETCHGYAVTELSASPSTGQVGDHWIELDEVIRRYIPDTEPEGRAS